MAMNDNNLPWCTNPFNRCRAVLPPNVDGHRVYFGQCDLKPHVDSVDHALERGFDTVRWSTKETDGTRT